MDFFSKSKVKNLLKKYQLRPSKRLGQNFLVDKRAVRKIIETAELRPDDIVLEIGPGLGVLTWELAQKAKKVITVEKDPNLARILNKELKVKNIKNVKIVQGDILKILNSKFLIPNLYKVVANLPFYLTAPVIRKFLETAEVKPRQLVLIVQKEVAQRICPCPPKLKERRRGKNPKMNLLAISVQFYAQPKIISYISKSSFWPQPEVDAAIIKLEVKSQKLKVNRDLFFKIVKAGFCQPRKQILNNFTKMLKLNKGWTKSWLLKNNIQPNQRAETLSIEDWLKLTKSLNEF